MKNFKLVLLALTTIAFASQTLAGIAKQKPPVAQEESKKPTDIKIVGIAKQKPPVVYLAGIAKQKPPTIA
jgi:hypothetical protein